MLIQETRLCRNTVAPSAADRIDPRPLFLPFRLWRYRVEHEKTEATEVDTQHLPFIHAGNPSPSTLAAHGYQSRHHRLVAKIQVGCLAVPDS